MKKLLEPSQEKRFSSAEIALEALQKPETVNLSFANHIGIKPVDTKIVFNKTADKLEIIKPGTGWNSSSFIYLINNTITSFVGLAFIMIFRHWSFFGYIPTLILIWIGFFNWADFLFELFGKTRLVIDRENLSLSYEIFGLKFNKPRPSLRKYIIKLEYTNSLLQEKTKSKRKISYKEISPAIIVWAGNQQYKLTGMTQTELDWLLNELSDYLEIPFQRRVIPVIKSD